MNLAISLPLFARAHSKKVTNFWLNGMMGGEKHTTIKRAKQTRKMCNANEDRARSLVLRARICLCACVEKKTLTRKNVTQTECAPYGPMKPYWNDSFQLIWLYHFNGHKHDRILYAILSTLYTLCTNGQCNVLWNELLLSLPPLSPYISGLLFFIDIFLKHMGASAHACTQCNLGIFFRMILEKKKANTEWLMDISKRIFFSRKTKFNQIYA